MSLDSPIIRYITGALLSPGHCPYHSLTHLPLALVLVGDQQDQFYSAKDQASKEKSDSPDGSWGIFTLYWKKAREEDRKMIARWKEEAGQVFHFVRVCLLCCVLSHSRTIDGFICCCRCDLNHALD